MNFFIKLHILKLSCLKCNLWKKVKISYLQIVKNMLECFHYNKIYKKGVNYG